MILLVYFAQEMHAFVRFYPYLSQDIAVMIFAFIDYE